MTLGLGILLATLLAGTYMAWSIGANDVANAMGTSVGSGALTLTAAIIVAGTLEFSGAVLVGSSVTETIQKGIIEVSAFEPTGKFGADGPKVLAVGMLAALLAAAVWLHLATHYGLPVSTTHSIVGAIVGVGIVSFGWRGIDWGTMGQIVMSWLVSPFTGGLIGFTTFAFIRRRILASGDPIGATRSVSPWLAGVVTVIMVLSFVFKALGNVIDSPPLALTFGVALAAGLAIGLVTRLGVRRSTVSASSPYGYVERIFSRLQITTACFVAFAHGANDVANAVGPLSAVVGLYRVGYATVAASVAVPFWVLVLGGAGIVVGLATLGYKVIATIGKQITDMTPTRGCRICMDWACASCSPRTTGATCSVMAASSRRMPA